MKELHELCIPVDPVIRKLLGHQYREWNGSACGTTEDPYKTCMRCKERFDSRKIKIYVRSYRTPSRNFLQREYLCGPCREKRKYYYIPKEHFKLYTWGDQ